LASPPASRGGVAHEAIAELPCRGYQAAPAKAGGSGTSGLSGLSQGVAESSEGALERICRRGPGLVRRLRGGCAWRASPKAEGGGGPYGPQDQRTPVTAGPAPWSRMRAVLGAISGGTRRSPHHRCPQAGTRSVTCQRAPKHRVPRGTVARHSQLVGPRGPSQLHGRFGSEGVPRTGLETELEAQCSEAVKATPSTLGSTTGRPSAYAAACRRFPRQRAASKGSPVCMIMRSRGTSFRAMVHTALVPGTPRARIASYSGR